MTTAGERPRNRGRPATSRPTSREGRSPPVHRPTLPGPRELIELITVVAAPVTVLTALFVYFGFLRTSTYYGYFGIGSAQLQFSTQDYVLRSGTVAAGAMVRLVLVGAGLLIVDRGVAWLIRPRPARPGKDGPTRPPRTRLAEPGSHAASLLATSVGAAAVLGGLSVAVVVPVAQVVQPLAGAALLAAGAVVLMRCAAARWQGRRRPAIVTALITLALVVSAFWAVSIQAVDLGHGAARAVAVAPEKLPLVTVFSVEPLDLPGRDVRANRIPGPDRRVWYRYTGLRLLTHANGRWFVITGRLAEGYRPSVAVLHDLPPTRVEVAVPAAD